MKKTKKKVIGQLTKLINNLIDKINFFFHNKLLIKAYMLKSVQHNDFDLYSKLSSFKIRKPDLKLILRITDDNGRLYSKLSRKPETRSAFTENCLDYILRFNIEKFKLKI